MSWLRLIKLLGFFWKGWNLKLPSPYRPMSCTGSPSPLLRHWGCLGEQTLAGWFIDVDVNSRVSFRRFKIKLQIETKGPNPYRYESYFCKRSVLTCPLKKTLKVQKWSQSKCILPASWREFLVGQYNTTGLSDTAGEWPVI